MIEKFLLPMAALIWQPMNIERGSRSGGRLESGDFQKNRSTDIRVNSGLGYADYGGSLKFFEHYSISDSFGASWGLGITATFSAGYDNTRPRSAFLDAGPTPFGRLTWEPSKSFGLVVDGGCDIIPMRLKMGSEIQDHQLRVRPYLGLGILVGI
jgi:hypothetical protein